MKIKGQLAYCVENFLVKQRAHSEVKHFFIQIILFVNYQMCKQMSGINGVRETNELKYLLCNTKRNQCFWKPTANNLSASM